MRVIEKKRRQTWRSMIDLIEAPFTVGAYIFHEFSRIIIVLVYIITIVELFKGKPIDGMTGCIIALAVVYFSCPTEVAIWFPILFYILFYGIILDATPKLFTCYVLSIGFASIYTMTHYFVVEIRESILKKIVLRVIMLIIVVYLLNTLIVSSVVHNGELRVEKGYVVSAKEYVRRHELTIKIGSYNYDETYLATKETYDKALEDGYVLVNVYRKWGIECSRLNERTGVFDGFL